MSSSPALIREVPGQRRVYRAEVNGQPCVTRVILHTRIPQTFAPLVRNIVLRGQGSMQGIIPEELQLTLEGYRVAASRLVDGPPPLPWTRAVAAGIDGEGHVTVSTRWIEGVPLHQAAPSPPDEARQRALDALRILDRLHALGVSYGDFKPENLVVRPEGSIALIDLDTLREATEATLWTPTRDLSRAWAAPEQKELQRTYLASDIWSWALIVRHLFPSGPPPAWDVPLAACRAGDPLRRPRTDALLAYLAGDGELRDWHGARIEGGAGSPLPGGGERREPGGASAPVAAGLGSPTDRVPEGPGPGSDATERVPEGAGPVGDATERVPEGAGPDLPGTDATADTPEAASAQTALGAPSPPAARTSLGCAAWFAGVLALPFLLCAGGVVWWDRGLAADADADADAGLAAWKANKTKPELNRDRGQREALRSMTEQAVAIRETPRSTSVHALSTVWAQGWQDSNKKWEQENHEAARAAIDAAPADAPETLLAAATLDGGECRLGPDAAARAAACDRSLDALDRLHRALPAEAEHNWLRVEAAWTEVLVLSERVARGGGPGGAGAEADLAAGLERCTQAEGWLAYAPVNGPELFQDCLRVAGLAGDVTRYLRWSDLLLAPSREAGAASLTALRHIFTAGGPGCDATTVKKGRREWAIEGPAWCVALGHAARRCTDLAVTTAAAGRWDEPSRPWSALDTALAGRADDCLR